MNYSMQGMTKVIPELFVMLKSTKVEIKISIKCWWLTRPLVSRKGQREEGELKKRTASKLLLKWRSLSLVLSLRQSASTAKGLVTGSGTTPTIWWIRRMAKWTKVYLIYRLLMCTLLVFIATPQYLILAQLLIFATRNRDYGLSEDWLRTRWRCAWEMVPKSMWSLSARTSTSTFAISFRSK